MASILATNDRIRITDKDSPYSGKIGVIKNIVAQKLIMLNGKPRTITTLEVELDSVNGIVSITSHPVPLESQVGRLNY